MKLKIVKASTGLQWVKLGILTFFKQPLALAGLFFMFMASVAIASMVPLLGSALALCLLPAATLGLMAATQEASKGKFPTPTILLSAFRAGRQRLNAMVMLGLLYAGGFLVVMGASALVDGGSFAKAYLMGEVLSRETVASASFQTAMWVSMALYLPLSLMFWHAPALVHWHNVAPVKSLFFSMVACLRNFGAFIVYGLAWMGVFLLAGLCMTLLSVLFGSPELASTAMLPLALVMASMFFTSIYFSFMDCFDAEPEAATEVLG
jgi:hypothetical protein